MFDQFLFVTSGDHESHRGRPKGALNSKQTERAERLAGTSRRKSEADPALHDQSRGIFIS